MTQPDSLAAIIAEMREPENSGQFGPWQITAANIKDWADRLAAIAGAGPVGYVLREDAEELARNRTDPEGVDAISVFAWAEPSPDRVAIFTHAPAKAREVTEEMVDLAFRAWDAAYAENSRDAIRAALRAALATFAEGD